MGRPEFLGAFVVCAADPIHFTTNWRGLTRPVPISPKLQSLECDSSLALWRPSRSDPDLTELLAGSLGGTLETGRVLEYGQTTDLSPCLF